MGGKARKRQKALGAGKRAFDRRKWVTIMLAGVALVLSAVGISAYESKQRQLHDLAVIGQGMPVIAQIHDPGCPTCRRLKNIVENTLVEGDGVLYRLADITTSKGKALQQQYNVPNVTLLFFDGKGKHVHTSQGIKTAQQIRQIIDGVFRHS